MQRRRLSVLLVAALAAPLPGALASTTDEGEVECDGAVLEDYNMTLAITSVFVVWLLSFAGAAFPTLLALKRHPYLILAIKFGSFAGSGVLLATGFVHMMFSAQENLSSHCLPQEGWLDVYPAWAFMFTVITIVLLQVLDYFLAVLLEPNPLETTSASMPTLDVPPPLSSVSDIETAAAAPPPPPPSPPPPPARPRGSLDEEDSASGSSIPESEPTDCNKHPACKDKECNGRTLLPAPEVSLKARAVSGLIMSEVSICTHSIIIGLTLGVTSASQFTALFIAIVFHQTLEGVALGSNAAEAGLSTRSILWLALTYSVTTPTGIAIGIGVRESLNTNSTPMLLTTGILDAVSAGTLIFLALGDHMNALKSQAGWLRAQRAGVQAACFASFFIGAAVLLVLALWA